MEVLSCWHNSTDSGTAGGTVASRGQGLVVLQQIHTEIRDKSLRWKQPDWEEEARTVYQYTHGKELSDPGDGGKNGKSPFLTLVSK